MIGKSEDFAKLVYFSISAVAIAPKMVNAAPNSAMLQTNGFSKFSLMSNLCSS